MLLGKVHLGTSFCDPNMERYTFKRKHDGQYILNLGKTWEKLQLAARAIVTIENPQDVVVISGRTWGQRAVFKYAQYTGAQYVAGRYTPGTFTNQIQKKFLEPRLLIVTDPVSDHQPVKEASFVNVPTIAFGSSDAPLAHVDIVIPCNNKHKNSIALMYWLLAREVLRMRGALARSEAWPVAVDLFVYRDPEEAEKEAKAAAEAAEASGETADDGAAEQKQADWEAGGGAAGTDAAAAVAPAAAGAVYAGGAADAGAGAQWSRAAPVAGWQS